MPSLELLKEWYDTVWVQQDLDAIDRLFTPDIEAQGVMDFGVGPDDFRVLAEAVLAQVEISEIRFDRDVAMGDWVWATFTVFAVTLADRLPVQTTGQIMARVKDGQVVEAYNQIDFLTFFEQLGYLPPDSLALCLSGEGIAA
ncbi:nuclear transport factor 2 family protein [Aliiroseovarius sp. S1339]|uniref:ester cyclase n=1 Tax=Aliiroseovarius sp. S1339 TaxID=2936990 RepID=UPI0020C0E80F|nr:nuclear transport factor 2 family protein [Aliiroseovarius sp. S1339]MCK8463813.1 nuclear transport factor 2 family protein [Aliiroseovarius sp. S1339]